VGTGRPSDGHLQFLDFKRYSRVFEGGKHSEVFSGWAGKKGKITRPERSRFEGWVADWQRRKSLSWLCLEFWVCGINRSISIGSGQQKSAESRRYPKFET